MDTQDFLHAFGLDAGTLQAGGLPVRSPIDGALLADLRPHDADDAQRMIDRAHQAFLAWRQVPAPRRGELVRLLGEELRAHKPALGRLVTLEAGKIAAHTEFDRSGRHALVSVWEADGALVVYDAATMTEVKRLPMKKPVGKYNVFNKITFSEGTSH